MSEALVIESADLRIAEPAIAQILVLRLGDDPPRGASALGRAIGAPLPTQPNRTAGDDPRIYWLAPREWAIVRFSPDSDVAVRIGRACAGRLHHVADMMQGWTVFEVRGEGARDLIASGCSLDLHPRAFAPGACAQTLLGQVPILLESPANDAFRFFVDRSYAAHVRVWLRDAWAGTANPPSAA